MILAIETSTTHASLAVASEESGELLAEENFVTNRAHNAVIFEPLSHLLDTYRDGLTGIVVGIGPGSYSGIRVGIAVANGLSLATELPVIGLSSLGAWETKSEDFLVVGDARRKSFFLAEIKSRQSEEEPMLLDVDDVGETLQPYFEQGVEIVTADVSVTKHFPEIALSFPKASILARNAASVTDSVWKAGAVLEPHYLRAPYITTPKPTGK